MILSRQNFFFNPKSLSPIDEARAERIEIISAKAAEKLMNRLHLMRKVHAIITMGIQNIRGMLKMVVLDVMPKGNSDHIFHKTFYYF